MSLFRNVLLYEVYIYFPNYQSIISIYWIFLFTYWSNFFTLCWIITKLQYISELSMILVVLIFVSVSYYFNC